jgi:N-acetyl-alpha-D-glucosaminyl L-malate synthase BshA
VTDVIEVFARIRAKLPARLLMIGDGPDFYKAEKRARELGLKKDIFFLGSQQAVQDLLPLADVFLLPSEFESFGLSNTEAMSCGVPVVSTSGSGIEESVADGVEGFLCKVGDVETMAERALRILTDGGLRATMGEAARKRVQDNYGQERVVAMYEEFYKRILERRQGHGA